MPVSALRSRRRIAFLTAACVFAAVSVLLFLHCRVGFASADEAFYLTIPLRLARGDALFVDEWHLSQMSSFLLLPFVYPYIKLVGTTTGIILAFRRIFTAVWTVGSLFVFWRMRRVSFAAAFVGALALMLFAPFGIMALSYNSLGVLNLALSAVLLCTAQSKRGGAVFAAGVFFAAAVLCCPYLAAVFLLYSLLFVSLGAARREKRRALFVGWLHFTLGVASLAVCFAVFVLSRASLRELLDAVPAMLSDPEHGSRSFMRYVYGYCASLLGHSLFFTLPLLADVVLVACAFFLRKKENRMRLLFGGVLCSTALWLMLIWLKDASINFLTLPMQVFPPFALCVVAGKNKDERDRTIPVWFVFGYLPALLYAVCIYLVSNTGLFAIGLACAVSLPACCLSLAYCAKTLCASPARPQPRRLLRAAAMAVAVLMIASFAAVRITRVYGSPSRGTLTETVTSGPYRGLLAEPENIALYRILETETLPVRQDASVHSVLYLSVNTVLCLFDQDAKNAGYSAWLSGVTPATLERLETYWSLRPAKEPQAVYYDFNNPKYPEQPRDAYAQYAQWLADRFGMTPHPTASGNIWFYVDE